MKMSTWKVFGTLLCLPAFALAQEESSTPAPAASAQVSRPAPQPSNKPDFDLRNSSVQRVISANARAASAPSQPQSVQYKTGQDLPVTLTFVAGAIEQQGIPFRASRRMQRMDCGLTDCVAYNADGDALFTIPREQYVGTNGRTASDEWMSCQSSNDLLTTFERYDKCRGIGIGLPLRFHDTIVKLPIIH